jgi:hypothetical protein
MDAALLALPVDARLRIGALPHAVRHLHCPRGRRGCSRARSRPAFTSTGSGPRWRAASTRWSWTAGRRAGASAAAARGAPSLLLGGGGRGDRRGLVLQSLATTFRDGRAYRPDPPHYPLCRARFRQRRPGGAGASRQWLGKKPARLADEPVLSAAGAWADCQSIGPGGNPLCPAGRQFKRRSKLICNRQRIAARSSRAMSTKASQQCSRSTQTM